MKKLNKKNSLPDDDIIKYEKVFCLHPYFVW